MANLFRIILVLLAIVLILFGLIDLFTNPSPSRMNISALVLGVIVLFLSLFNGGRRLFSDPDDSLEKDSMELVHDVTWRNIWTYLTMHFGALSVLSDKASRNPALEARKERVAAARRKVKATAMQTDEQTEQAMSDVEDDIDDYWALPKIGAPTTILNSAWTWTLIIYVLIMGATVTSIAGTGLPLVAAANSDVVVIVIAVALIYPAWRIGYMISKYLKRRGVGEGTSLTNRVSDSLKGTPRADKASKARPGSVEARMAERRARLEKAREEGKI